ncbi:MAG: DUF6677 family protein [Planctomycetota bacterium]|jgi:hypothetical protein
METPGREKPDPVTAVILAILLPGGGHLYGGRFGKAVFFFVLIVGTFLAGLILSDFRGVSLKHQPYWFLGQVFAGLPSVAAAVFSPDWKSGPGYSVALEAGTLYTTVAGLMNILVVLDAAFPADFKLLFNVGEEDVQKDPRQLYDGITATMGATAIMAAFGSLSGALQILRSLSFAQATENGVSLPQGTTAGVFKAPSGALVVLGGNLTGEQRDEAVDRFRKEAREIRISTPEGEEVVHKNSWWKR